MQYTKVIETAEAVAIVGSGESLRGTDLIFPSHVKVMAVNGAIDFLKQPPDFWFTLDPHVWNQIRMDDDRAGTKYYAAVPEDGTLDHCIPSHVHCLRRIGGKLGDITVVEYRLPWDKGIIHNGNSGWGALQLAVHMRTKRIALFGLDGAGGYAHTSEGPKPGVHAAMPALFDSAVEQLRCRGIKVINGSKRSTVTAFPRVTPEDAMKWICTPQKFTE